jgi:hypothetical protein
MSETRTNDTKCARCGLSVEEILLEDQDAFLEEMCDDTWVCSVCVDEAGRCASCSL